MKTVLILVVIGFLIGAMTDGSSNSNYGDCMKSETTDFNAQLYKQKYPNLSLSQIKHNICK